MAPKAKLTYFAYKALGEPIRYMLANGGIEFEDIRIDAEDWPQINKDQFPFGKVPVLEIEGRTLFQSAAICRYLAKQQGLAGADALEDQQIDAIVDTIADMRSYIVYYGYRTEESEKPRKKEKLLTERLPNYLNNLEMIAKKNKGYLVNGKLTYADIFFAGSIEFLSAVMETDLTEGRPTLQSIVKKVHSVPRIKAWVQKRPKTLL